MKDICLIQGGKRIPKGFHFASSETGHPYLRVSDFSEGSVRTEGLKYIGDEVFDKISRYTISKNDIYISIAGTIGLVGTIPDELDGANLTENAAKLIVKDSATLDKEYLALSLQSNDAQRQIKENTHIVGVPKLALARIAQIEIPIVPMSEQRKIVSEVLHYRQEIENAERIMRECRERQNGVIDKYLSN